MTRTQIVTLTMAACACVRAQQPHQHAPLTAETVVPFRGKNPLTGRFEWGQRDELFDPHLAAELERQPGKHVFPVAAYTIGYTRDVDLFRTVQSGIGTNLRFYGIDAALEPFYGDRPWGVNLFPGVRLKSGE